MKTIVIKNISDDLAEWLERRANAHGRGLEDEVVHVLEEAQSIDIPDPQTDPEGFIRLIEEEIAKTKGPGLTLEDIERAINEGRP